MVFTACQFGDEFCCRDNVVCYVEERHWFMCGWLVHSCDGQKLTEVDALLHEGTIPESASRLTTADVAISVGH
eukprot:6470510-Amphidinium_carterae.1